MISPITHHVIDEENFLHENLCISRFKGSVTILENVKLAMRVLYNGIFRFDLLLILNKLAYILAD
jgi:hypothetical protein